ncbi:ATP-binding cassette domain-containing protein [Methylobacillus arboreus]|uniref:ATP-binding cassette domain-containing protein n=1 Tax=Methylobacillus arboreus TaxID=755170 RepID=UPI001E611B94|nr:ATP-binding cassette domain-containing protein [Methylobacillus arboreus]MCB5190908.1 ATP-binding cassette domain-containing protein [Methylobacillus arboreus]
MCNLNRFKTLEPGTLALAFAVLGLFVLFAATIPHYASATNIEQLLRDYAEPALIVTGMTIVIISGGIDLSVGAVFAIANFVALYLFKVHGLPLAATVPLTLAAGLAIGLVNGLLIGYVKTRPFLTTLAMLLILRACYELAADSYAVELVDAFNESEAWDFMGSGAVAGIPVNMLALLVAGLLVHLLLIRSRPGSHLTATGANRKAARHAGIRVNRIILLVYALSGLLSAAAGLLYAARQNSAGTDTGVGMELMAITACVIGGVSLAGGKGTIPRALLGAAFIFLLMNGLLRFNISGSISATITGVILLAAIAAISKAKPQGLRDASTNSSALLPVPLAVHDIEPSEGHDRVVSLLNISKQYAGHHALRRINLDLHAGEIMALLGENGAGKSTLCKIIAGAVAPSSGQLLVNLEPAVFRNPADSIKAGIAMVYQETSLIEHMTVAQNIVLGQEPWIYLNAAILEQIRGLLREFFLDIDPLAEVASLSIAQKQLVETMRAIRLKARVMVFDEPTASLSQAEAEFFFSLLRRLRAQGISIVLITHALEEALAVADCVTVLRDGDCVRQRLPVGSLDRATLIQLMVGRDTQDTYAEPHQSSVPAVSAQSGLALRHLTLSGSFADISLDFPAGRITGIAGLVGSGRTEIARAACGALHTGARVQGQVLLQGRPVECFNPRQAIENGIVYVTENRHEDGLFATMDVADNLYLALLSTRKGWRFWYSKHAAKAVAADWIAKLGISGLHPGQAASTYSGGNQQKILIARALSLEPQAVFFDEPTHGVDIGAIARIHAVIQELAAQGRIVILVSSYLPEILKLSSRIVVLRKGKVAGELSQPKASQDSILNLAAH